MYIIYIYGILWYIFPVCSHFIGGPSFEPLLDKCHTRGTFMSSGSLMIPLSILGSKPAGIPGIPMPPMPPGIPGKPPIPPIPGSTKSRDEQNQKKNAEIHLAFREASWEATITVASCAKQEQAKSVSCSLKQMKAATRSGKL